MMVAEPPCFALGYVEAQGEVCGFLALRPEAPIPATSTRQGFRFGHSALGTEDGPVLHFAFDFYGHKTYHGLVNPGNPIVKSVLATMIEKEDYFFFALNPDQTVTVFRSKLEHQNLAGLKTNQKRFSNACCSDEQYESVFQTFSKNPNPPGQVMTWVCRDNPEYLDLTEHRLELQPRAK
jgi:hypothetical protein